MAPPVKVRVTVTVAIDPEAWVLNYGTDASVQAVRADVQAYITSLVQDQLREVGVLARPTG
jgi:hypothetical protein